MEYEDIVHEEGEVKMWGHLPLAQVSNWGEDYYEKMCGNIVLPTIHIR